MSPDTIKAIIAGVATIISAILTVVVKNYLDKKKESERYKNVGTAIQEAVSGKWKGDIKQTLNSNAIFVQVDSTFKVSENGMIKGEIILPYENRIVKLLFTGGFYSLRFIKLEYENSNKAILQFGSIVLKLSDDSTRLKGHFVGYGHISGDIIAGNINFTKV